MANYPAVLDLRIHRLIPSPYDRSGSQFGDRYMHVAKAFNVEENRIGVQAHPSLGFGGLYHEPLRTTYHKIMEKHPSADRHVALIIARTAMNDSLGSEGLVPSTLSSAHSKAVRDSN